MARRDDEELFYVYADIAMLEKGILDTVKSKTNDLDPAKYKFLHTYRPAFIGDMQEKLDEAMQTNMMEYYAHNCGRYTEYVWNTVTIEKTVSIFFFIKRWIKEKMEKYKKKIEEKKQRKKDNMWLEEQLFGPKL